MYSYKDRIIQFNSVYMYSDVIYASWNCTQVHVKQMPTQCILGDAKRLIK